MHANVTIDAAELVDLTPRPAVPVHQGRTLVWLGGAPSSVSAWVTADDAEQIADAWRDLAATLAFEERKREWPTLAEATADRDDALTAETSP